MGEEADTGYEFSMYEGDEDGGSVREWEVGLPAGNDLTPLSQILVPPELASAFRIPPEPGHSARDVHRASQHTVSSLRRSSSSPNSSSSPVKPFHPFTSSLTGTASAADPSTSAPADDADSSAAGADDQDNEQSAKTVKRPRLVWTPQLHKRFVDVVSHLGLKNAVPKTIMQLMNVEGLTRENVASHLQKYRLYVKRMQGLSTEGGPASPADSHLFASTPFPQNLREPAPPVHMPVPYTVPMYPMPMYGMPNGHGTGMGMMPITGGNHGLAGNGNGFGPGASYPHHVNHGDK